MFEDRRQAGRLLGRQLKATSLPSDLIIGLARGGVVVAAEISNVLGTPFDVLVVKKIGSPATRELAIGAVAP
jgi:putative phosphoribosyl transferase